MRPDAPPLEATGKAACKWGGLAGGTLAASSRQSALLNGPIKEPGREVRAAELKMARKRRAKDAAMASGAARTTTAKTTERPTSNGVALLFAVAAVIAAVLMARTAGVVDKPSDVDKAGIDSASASASADKEDTVAETGLVAEAIRQVRESTELSTVRTQLPQVAVAPLPGVQELTTTSFTSAVNRSETALTLVAFYDPRSESYLAARDEMQQAAEALREHPVLGSNAMIATVNAAVDTYLQEQFSPEMTSSWQQVDREAEHSTVFVFGETNFYPIVFKLFRRGAIVEEFVEPVRAKNMIAFLARHSAPRSAHLATAEAAHDFAAAPSWPAAVACLPGPAATREQVDALVAANEPAGCGAAAEAFFNLTGTRHGWLYYATASGAACAALDDALEPCALLVVSDDGSRSVLAAAQAAEAGAMQAFAERHRDAALVELTPDNSWDMIRQFKFLAILLDNVEVDSQARPALRQVARETAQPNIKFVHANGREFGAQFNIEPEDLPNVVLYDTVNDKVTVFHNASQPAAANALRTAATASEAADHVRAWVDSQVTEIEAALEEQRKAGAEAEAPKKRQEQDSEAKAKQEKEDKEQAAQRITSWRKLSLFNLTGVQFRGWEKLEWLYGDFLKYYGEILLYEEAYSSMDPSTRALDENRVIRELLDEFFARMNSRKHLRLLMETLPKTPLELQKLSSDQDALLEMWRNLQQLSGYLSILKHVVGDNDKDEDRAKPRSPEVAEVMEAFAQDYAFARNTLVRLLRRRSEAFLGRFKREHGGRAPEVSDQPTMDIERRSADGLSVREFVEEYASKRRPVIITGLKLSREPWTREHVAAKCGHHTPVFSQKREGTHKWGGLEDVTESVNLTTFIATHQTNATRKGWYLHDWGLPRHCPEILGEPPYRDFIFPRYFAGDFFQRIPFVGYQHSWPSLFVGAKGTESAMHIDSGGTNFWMYLVEGEKEWRFFDRMENINLYGQPGSSHYFVDVFRPDMAKNPLLATAPMYVGRQRPGDLVFIPAGCPHGVRNHDDIVALSMNYLDVSNQWLYLWMSLLSEDYRDYELYATPEFPRGLDSKQPDLTFGEFKSQRWYERHDDLDLF